MKKSLSLVLVMLMVMATCLSACGGSSTGETEAKTSDTTEVTTSTKEVTTEAVTKAESTASTEPIKIGCSIADQTNVFYIDILDGMKSALKAGDDLIAVDAGFDAAKQISDIEDLIQQGVDVMLIDPVDSNGIQAALQQCKDAGIPVIAYNSPCDDASMVTSTVASDNFMAGQLIGEALAKALDGKGEVVMLTYNVAQVCLDRANGFKDSIAKYPDIKIEQEEEIQPGVDTALPVMENMLQAYPDLDGVFALNDPSAIGCVAAVESAKKLDQIKIVGVDGSDDGKAAIAAGKMLATAAQHPVEIGSISIETAYKILAGEKVEADIKVPVELIDKTNAAN